MDVLSNPDSWCVVVNIYAASKKAATLWHRAELRLAEDKIPYNAVYTGNGANARTLTLSVCQKGWRRFVAVGGDGTIHDVLEGIMAYIESVRNLSLNDFTLSVIPVGSGNDWIKTAGIPNDIIKAASLLHNGKLSSQDVVKVSMLDPAALPQEKVLNVAYMANVGGVGLDARVCERVNRDKERGKRGKGLYVRALLYNILHRFPSFARVCCDGEEVFNGNFLSMAFGVGKYSGGGMRQTPDAVLDDGLLDMTIIPYLPITKIAKEAPRLFNGSFLAVKELVCAKARSITILPYSENDSQNIVAGEPVEVDGEVVGFAPVRFDILEGRLNILTSY